jgi:hypothetical protein
MKDYESELNKIYVFIDFLCDYLATDSESKQTLQNTIEQKYQELLFTILIQTVYKYNISNLKEINKNQLRSKDSIEYIFKTLLNQIPKGELLNIIKQANSKFSSDTIRLMQSTIPEASFKELYDKLNSIGIIF